jgi:hypothetical protein
VIALSNINNGKIIAVNKTFENLKNLFVTEKAMS